MYPVSVFMNNHRHISQNGAGSQYFDWFGLIVVSIICLVFIEKFARILFKEWRRKKGEKHGDD